MDWATSVNENVQLNILAGLKAGLNTEGIVYLKNVDKLRFDSIIRDPLKELNGECTLAFDRGGIPLTICGYYDGENVINRTTAINIPELLTGGQGQLLHSNAVTVFKNKTKMGEYHLKKLRDYCLENVPNFKGWISLDVVFVDGKFHYRGIKIGVLHDIAYAMQNLYALPMDMIDSEFLVQAEIMDNFSCCLRMFGYPYDEEYNMQIGDVLSEEDHQYIKEGAGYYLVSGTGNKINKAWTALYEKIPDVLRLFGVCYRTDGLIESQKIFNQLYKEGLV